MTSYVTMKKEVVLGKHCNIEKIVKVGDSIKTGYPLMVFEDVGGDEFMGSVLDYLGKEMGEAILENSQSIVKSKYTGVVEDIRIYSTVPDEELSPSLRKIVKEYNARVGSKRDKLNEYYGDEESNIILPPSEVVQPVNNKIKGVEIPGGEGVLIEFYVKYADELGVGDKITYYTALKSIISEKIPDNLAPYSDYRPDEPIEAILATISVNARMTGSVFLSLWSNKVLIELKRKCKDIFDR